VALFDRRDLHHEDAVAFIQGFRDRAFTTWPVVAEAAYLLDFHADVLVGLFEWLQNSGLQIEATLPDEWERVIALTRKYADLPIDFADASLVTICERLGTRWVATLDSHFQVYRYNDRLVFQNAFPL
jgi:uncharacterized protein